MVLLEHQRRDRGTNSRNPFRPFTSFCGAVTGLNGLFLVEEALTSLILGK